VFFLVNRNEQEEGLGLATTYFSKAETGPDLSNFIPVGK
jgi:hypothetical protein